MYGKNYSLKKNVLIFLLNFSILYNVMYLLTEKSMNMHDISRNLLLLCVVTYTYFGGVSISKITRNYSKGFTTLKVLQQNRKKIK